MENGVAAADLLEEPVSSNTSEEDDGVDYGRVFTYTHANGEVVTGTILDIRAECIGIGSLTISQAFRVAEAHDKGTALIEKEEEPDPKEDDEGEPKLDKKATKKNDAEEDEIRAGSSRHENETVPKKVPRETEYPTELVTPRPEVVKTNTPVAKAGRAGRHVSESEAVIVPTAANFGSPVEKSGTAMAPSASEITTGPVGEGSQDTRKTQPASVETARSDNLSTPEAKIATPSSAEYEAVAAKVVIEMPTQRPAPDSEATTEDNRFDAWRYPEPSIEGYEIPEVDRADGSVSPLETGIDAVDTDFVLMEDEEADPDETEVAESFDPELFDTALPEYIASEPEAIYDLPVGLEAVETIVQELGERIDSLEIEEIEVVNEILDEIALKLESAQTVLEIGEVGQEVNSDASEELKEELKELFVELFEYVGMEYSPDLIEAFVKLALEQDLAELILEPGQKDKDNSVFEQGTHEIMAQLLATISSLKRKLANAVTIGNSALNLYAKQFVLA